MIPQRNNSLLSNRLAREGGRRIPEAVLERDYCLAWFLVGLSRSPLREQLAFKGGTALKHCYFGDYRFSEDLDLTLTEELSLEDILAALGAARAAFGHSGAYRGDTAVARQSRFHEQLDTSGKVALARSVLLLHEKVSEERKRAAWAWEDQGVLFSDADVERPSDRALQVGVAWRNDYYLEPPQGIAKQLAEVRQ